MFMNFKTCPYARKLRGSIFRNDALIKCRVTGRPCDKKHCTLLPEDCERILNQSGKTGRQAESDKQKVNVVTVRWWDGYKEDFRATEIRFGSDLLWMRLEDGANRHIPLRQVRWFGTSIESHQNTGM